MNKMLLKRTVCDVVICEYYPERTLYYTQLDSRCFTYLLYVLGRLRIKKKKQKKKQWVKHASSHSTVVRYDGNVGYILIRDSYVVNQEHPGYLVEVI